jgi:cytochrome c-type biogenesis protein CcmH
MIDFWLAAGLLLVIALAFVLVPLLRGRRAQAEEDRTALNVALYHERLAQLHDGVLSAEQRQVGQAEAARELLADTEGASVRSAHLGRVLPLLAAVLVPLVALGLYLHWGGSRQVAEYRALASLQQGPQDIASMTARLQQQVRERPDSAEAWYFLGRVYMAQNRAEEAAAAFERAVGIAGRAPELLGQWAQALYFAAGKHWSARLQSLTDEALAADPNEVTSLGLLGIAAFESQRYADAVDYWQRLLALLPPGDPSIAAIQGGIDRARERLPASGTPDTASQPSQGAKLRVRVTLAESLKSQVRPGDAVFVFARAAAGPPMPLAVKRLSVAQLPAEVELTDADAMMPQLKLSAFAQVQLLARISRAGDATAGEWIGHGGMLANDVKEQQTVIIDTRDQAK